MHELNQDTYDRPTTWIKSYNGIACHTMGSIKLPLQVGPKKLDFTFSIILKMDQFHLRYGYPWLCALGAIVLTIYKFLKFPFDKDLYTMHHSGFNPMAFCGNFLLDYFWFKPMEPIKPHEELFFLSYQNFKVECIARISLQNTTEHCILDETMIKPKDLLQDQHKIENQENTT